MKWIDLHIKCYNEDEKAAEWREMGIDTPPAYDYRPLKLRIDHIVGYYPTTDGGSFIFVVNGDELTVKENCATIKNYIDADFL